MKDAIVVCHSFLKNGSTAARPTDCVYMCVCFADFQTIVSAMSTLIPPIPVGNPGNQFRVDYIRSIAPLSDFEYTEVTHTHTHITVLRYLGYACVGVMSSLLDGQEVTVLSHLS